MPLLSQSLLPVCCSVSDPDDIVSKQQLLTRIDALPLQTDLQPAEQLRMVRFVAAADTIHHHIGTTRCRGDSAQCLDGAYNGGLFGSWSLAQSR
jgi:hypothetical protein